MKTKKEIIQELIDTNNRLVIVAETNIEYLEKKIEEHPENERLALQGEVAKTMSNITQIKEHNAILKKRLK